MLELIAALGYQSDPPRSTGTSLVEGHDPQREADAGLLRAREALANLRAVASEVVPQLNPQLDLVESEIGQLLRRGPAEAARGDAPPPPQSPSRNAIALRGTMPPAFFHDADLTDLMRHAPPWGFQRTKFSESHVADLRNRSWREVPRGRTCAVVGSSSSLLERALGAEIDAADVIIRVNEAPIAGFEEDVGMRTTLRVATLDPIERLLRAPLDRAGLVTYCHLPWMGKCWVDETARTNKKAMRMNESWRWQPTPRLNPAFVRHVKRQMNLSHWPTSGGMAVWLGMALCGTVRAYGFGETLGDCSKYYDCFDSSQYLLSGWHSMFAEKAALARLQAGGLVTMVDGVGGGSDEYAGASKARVMAAKNHSDRKGRPKLPMGLRADSEDSPDGVVSMAGVRVYVYGGMSAPYSGAGATSCAPSESGLGQGDAESHMSDKLRAFFRAGFLRTDDPAEASVFYHPACLVEAHAASRALPAEAAAARLRALEKAVLSDIETLGFAHRPHVVNAVDCRARPGLGGVAAAFPVLWGSGLYVQACTRAAEGPIDLRRSVHLPFCAEPPPPLPPPHLGGAERSAPPRPYDVLLVGAEGDDAARRLAHLHGAADKAGLRSLTLATATGATPRSATLDAMRNATFTLCVDAASACPYDALGSGSVLLLQPDTLLPPLPPLGALSRPVVFARGGQLALPQRPQQRLLAESAHAHARSFECEPTNPFFYEHILRSLQWVRARH